MESGMWPTVDEACGKAYEAFEGWSRAGGAERAGVLRAIAAALEARRDEIIHVCAEETALYPEELSPEFGRMTGTLRMFADLVSEGSWVRAAIDHAVPGGAGVVGPNHDVRKMLLPLGPVAVFGASNFPLAYGVCGGDTASALAAGCPVVVKEHPAHLRTGRLIARTVIESIHASGIDDQVLGYVLNERTDDFEPAKALLAHPFVRAVGFTGSVQGGSALSDLARSRPSGQIPVFAEMGSANVVLVQRGALAARAAAIAHELADALLTRHGQQCTRPGILILESTPGTDELIQLLTNRMNAAPARRMLSLNVAKRYVERLDAMRCEVTRRLTTRPARTNDAGGLVTNPVALLHSGPYGLDDPVTVVPRDLLDEVFGPAVLIVKAHGPLFDEEIWVDGRLTTSIYSEGADDLAELAEYLPQFTSRAGRLVFNSPPTGVRVATGMVHGGPCPATNRPESTAVGPLAIERWCRPVCYQNCPDALLPAELRDGNPLGIMRVADGVAGRR